MSSGSAEQDSGGGLPRVDRMNYIVQWDGDQPLVRHQPRQETTVRIHPAFGNAALSATMSMEAEAAAEAARLVSFNEMDALMQEPPGA